MVVFRRARRQNPGFGAKNRPKSLFLGRFSRRLGSRSALQHVSPGARWTCGNGLVGTCPKLCLSRISIFLPQSDFFDVSVSPRRPILAGFRVRRRQKRPFFVCKKAFFRLFSSWCVFLTALTRRMTVGQIWDSQNFFCRRRIKNTVVAAVSGCRVLGR